VHRVWLNVVLNCLVLCVPSGLLLSQQPDAFESLVASAKQAQAKSDFQAAAEFYKQAVAIHPENPELRTNLGLMYYQTGKNEQAAIAFREAIRLKPALFVPNLFLGLDYIRLKRFKEAVPYLKKAALSNPADVQTYLSLGEAYAGAGDARLATASYLQATQLAPKGADAWYHLGVSYLEQVEADARILLTRHKDSGYLRVLIADNFFDQQAFGAAAETYKKALLSPSFPAGTHASYGFVLIRQHDLQAAERELNSELNDNPGSLLAKLGVARLRLEQGDKEEAANRIQEIWNTDSGFFRANISKFNAGLEQTKRSELEQLLQGREAAGELPSAFITAFRVDAASEPRDQAASRKEVAVQPSRTNIDASTLYANGNYRQCAAVLASRSQTLSTGSLRILATCAYLTGDYKQAFSASTKLSLSNATEAEGLYWETKSAQKLATEALGHASEMDSGSPKLHVLLGDLYRQRSFFPDAEQEYRKALALAPSDTGALFGLSLALLADNQLDQAFEVAQSALRNNADDPELNAVMGEILCARDDFPGAEPYLKKSLNTKPEYVSHVHALLGSVYAKTNRTQEAVAELKLALVDDKDGHIHYQLARLYLKTGDREAAKQAFETSNRLRSEGLNRAAIAMQQNSSDKDWQ
jgi:tetratricopeptide (TPR) repeat protein